MATRPAPEQIADVSLVRRIAEHQDEDALRLLVCRYAPKVNAYLLKQFGNRLRAPEIDQAANETFYNLWRFADHFDPSKGGSLGGWLIRISQRVALSIIRGPQNRHIKRLEIDPPSDECEETAEFDQATIARIQIMEEIIEKELSGFEQIVARADVAVGDAADSKRLAEEHGKSLNSVYVTRNKVREKIKRGILEREAKLEKRKDTHEFRRR